MARATKKAKNPRIAETATRMRRRVQLVVEAGPHASLSTPQIRRRAESMLDALQLQNEELSLLLTGDDQIHELNKVYRGKDRPTDVLAFAQREGELASLAGGVLGDVVISVPTAQRQARAAKRDLLAEVTMLLAHGLLHLLGWDHETAAKDKKMRAETERLIAASIAAETRGTKDAATKVGERAIKRSSARRADALSAPDKPVRASRGKH